MSSWVIVGISIAVLIYGYIQKRNAKKYLRKLLELEWEKIDKSRKEMEDIDAKARGLEKDYRDKLDKYKST